MVRRAHHGIGEKMFITFEGGEGSGKTTQINLLADYLKELSKEVVLTSEPGGSNVGQKIRQLIFDNKLEPYSEIFLFAADRVDHVEKIIRPALEAGKIVLCDRYSDSTFAYQYGGRGLPEDFVRYTNMVACRDISPDITILLDIPVEKGIERVKSRGNSNRFDDESIGFHKRIRSAYLQIAENDKERFFVVNADQSIEGIFTGIKGIIDSKIK